ncbi:ABC transporter permease subunit [Alteribacter aurantiacus]|uniref:ABC transporter permease subunit n=1 Tax=Alteribacter aurantiacus TaxID=254410 RepID=UPI000429D352|nr:ABC transporter permease subunit [Alteribacter aurantiacus]
MYKHECFKIFSKPSIYIVFALVVGFLVWGEQNMRQEVVFDDSYNDMMEEWGGFVTEEKHDLAREKMRLSDGGETVDSLHPLEGNAHFSIAAAWGNKVAMKDRIATLEEKREGLSPSSYEYRSAAKEESMLEKVGEVHGLFVVDGWRGMFDFLEPFFSVVLLTIFILVGLSPVFADEYSKRTTGLIFATKHGRKKLVTAKLLAGATYILAIFVLLHGINTFIHVVNLGGLQGWNVPMQSLWSTFADWYSPYGQSPFSWNVLEFWSATLTVQFFGSLVFGVLVLVMSQLTRNGMVAFFVSGTVLAIPFVIRQLNLERGVMEYVTTFSYMELIRTERLFQTFEAFNVFGFPVLYHTALIVVFCVITVVILVLLYWSHRRTQVAG